MGKPVLKKITAVSGAALVLLTAVFFSCGGQKTLNAYTTLEEPLALALFAEFENDTGIHVEFISAAGTDTIERLEAEKNSPWASIWIGGTELDHITAKDKGLTIPYNSRAAKKIPLQYRDSKHYWAGMFVGALTFMTNIKRAKELGLAVPQSWADLTKREYRGHISMGSPVTSGTAYKIITTIRSIQDGSENRMFAYLKKLDENIAYYTYSGFDALEAAAAGEVAIAIGYAHDQVKFLAEGAPVEITVPKEGSGLIVVSVSLLKNGRQKAAAKKLHDWLISSSGAEKIFAQWRIAFIRQNNVEHAIALPNDEIHPLKQDLQWDGDPANRERLMTKWREEIGSRREN